MICEVCQGGGCSVCFRAETTDAPRFASGKEIEEFIGDLEAL
jgi:hypothetical protein